MIIRRATPADAEPLQAVVAAAYAPFADLDLPPVADGLAGDIRDHNVWVAEDAGDVQGGVVLVLGATAHLANLAVAPAAGGQGIGRALIDAATAAARAAGHASITLATHRAMDRTQAFYRRLGWAETGREGHKVYFALQLNEGDASWD